MRLTTYFRAMEAADARIRLLADHNVTDTGQYYHAQMRCNHLRTGLIRRMEAMEAVKTEYKRIVPFLAAHGFYPTRFRYFDEEAEAKNEMQA